MQSIARYNLDNPTHENSNAHFTSKVWVLSNEVVKSVTAKSNQAKELLYREHKFLYTLHFLKHSNHFPKVIEVGRSSQTGMEYNLVMHKVKGEKLAKRKVPGQHKEKALRDLDEIQKSLLTAKISHKDIHSRNIIWDGERLVLIDFGWARFTKEKLFTPRQIECPDDGAAFRNMRKLINA